MNILLTNRIFETYSGTEIVVRDLALAFSRAGHRPMIFAGKLGPIADEVRRAGIEVADDLSKLTVMPEIIHGQNHQQMMEALLYFPDVPAIYLSHDGSSIYDEPIFFPRILRYFAVDERCKERVVKALGSARSEITLMPNAVDMGRFKRRGPLPEKPHRALLFSNYASSETHLPAVKKACRRAGISLDVMGIGTGTSSAAPEQALPQYDLVFAKARCALEAMAVGCAVVLCDYAGTGTYVTADAFDAMRRKNFGRALLTQALSADVLLQEMAKYDAADAAAVCAKVRVEAGLETAAAQWLSIYAELLKNFHPENIDRGMEGRATMAYLQRWHAFRRRQWEIDQLSRLKRIPLAGDIAFRIAGRALRRWSDGGGEA